ncbi:hypothetical protein DICPUDRAFT_146650 [Dictyostelium purpureum]|uniref:Chromo domain-containing protein n=1 Tax=Dictyostelium purpureum TaxID=5786 RepID=F0Z6I3_DICPU|nr:uncharacterized protein DICPUDRAFT_146650 [Dictyostelium purpureum]EGC40495.1 hypothetical protein DICPUDRAFT_146650 [Dictyostelium purpureum]|eukprot:XP_003283042.1 hypothetical protein DICPUDRAFT_146650 [Dictyostelium purpureum]
MTDNNGNQSNNISNDKYNYPITFTPINKISSDSVPLEASPQPTLQNPPQPNLASPMKQLPQPQSSSSSLLSHSSGQLPKPQLKQLHQPPQPSYHQNQLSQKPSYHQPPQPSYYQPHHISQLQQISPQAPNKSPSLPIETPSGFLAKSNGGVQSGQNQHSTETISDSKKEIIEIDDSPPATPQLNQLKQPPQPPNTLKKPPQPNLPPTIVLKKPPQPKDQLPSQDHVQQNFNQNQIQPNTNNQTQAIETPQGQLSQTFQPAKISKPNDPSFHQSQEFLKIQQYNLNSKRLEPNELQKLSSLEQTLSSTHTSFNQEFQNILISTCFDYIYNFDKSGEEIAIAVENAKRDPFLFYAIGCQPFATQETLHEATLKYRAELEKVKRTDLMLVVDKAYNQVNSEEKRRQVNEKINNRVICPTCKSECFIAQAVDRFLQHNYAACYQCRETCFYCTAGYTLPGIEFAKDRFIQGACVCVLCKETIYLESIYPNPIDFPINLREYYKLKRARDEELYRSVLYLGYYSSNFIFDYNRALEMFSKDSFEYRHFVCGPNEPAPENYKYNLKNVKDIEKIMSDILRLGTSNVNKFQKRPYDHVQRPLPGNRPLITAAIALLFKELSHIDDALPALFSQISILVELYYKIKRDIENNEVSVDYAVRRQRDLLVYLKNFKIFIDGYHRSFNEKKFIPNSHYVPSTYGPNFVSQEISCYILKLKNEHIYLSNRFKYVMDKLKEFLNYLNQKPFGDLTQKEEAMNDKIKNNALKLELFQENFVPFSLKTSNSNLIPISSSQTISFSNQNKPSASQNRNQVSVSHTQQHIQKPQHPHQHPHHHQHQHNQQHQQRVIVMDTKEEIERRVRLKVHEAWNEFNEIAKRRNKTNYNGPILLLTNYSESEKQKKKLKKEKEEKRRKEKERRRQKEIEKEKRKKRKERDRRDKKDKHKKKKLKLSQNEDVMDEEPKDKDRVEETQNISKEERVKEKEKENERDKNKRNDNHDFDLSSTPPPIDKDLEPINITKSSNKKQTPNKTPAPAPSRNKSSGVSIDKSPTVSAKVVDKKSKEIEENFNMNLFTFNEKNESMDDNKDIYTVEKILSMRIRGGIKEYLIKWEGYDVDEATWEAKSDCYCTEMINEYEKRQGSKNKKK